MPANQSDNSQGNTGTRDITYDLISTAYHLLQGAETVALYIADAKQEGDEELVKFFTETKEAYQRRAEQAKQLLTQHLGRQGEKQGQAASGK
ncbi:MAG: hypothetical protein LC802_08835 [Acidobacteria bacterium]|nr:hypothetical protein [Acidobacteriota bacterium]